jgi:hypothetical protein
MDKMAQILKKVNDAIAPPDEMSASEALEFVRDLIGELNIIIDGLEIDKRRNQ